MQKIYQTEKAVLMYSIRASLGQISHLYFTLLCGKQIGLTFLVGRNAILLNGWKGSPSAVNNTRTDSKETFSYGLPNLTLESQGSATNPW